MFAHVLAVLLGFSSFIFYMAAFFYPEVHRRSDIWLSGLGLVYAAVLWFCAGQMTGLVLLAQVISVALLNVLGWQTLSIRREKTPVYQQTPVVLTPEVVGTWAKDKINQLRIAPDDTVRPLRPQNPSLNATSAERFKPPLDPRRRPVYDYEFVEDGILSEMPEQPLSEQSVLEVVETEGIAEVVPSVAAEVIGAIAPTPEPVNEIPSDESAADLDESAAEDESVPEVIDSTTAVESTAEAVVPNPSAAEASTAESPATESLQAESLQAESLQAESETKTRGDTVSDALTSQSTEAAVEEQSPVNIDAEASDVDDWGLDENDSWADDGMSSPAKTSTRSSFSKEKPSLLVMPLILAAWVKDVVASLTKPKPAKPVIEIPRRDISNARDLNNRPVAEATPSAEPIVKANREPTIEPAASYANNPTPEEASASVNTMNTIANDNWEESNWDD